MQPPLSRGRWKSLRGVLIVALSVLVITIIFRVTEAGSLTPTVAPAGTGKSAEQVYAPLASSGYDSSAVVANKNGNALQVAKCIINKMTGGTPCP